MTFLRTILGRMVSSSVHLSFHPLFYPPPFPNPLSIYFFVCWGRKKERENITPNRTSLLLYSVPRSGLRLVCFSRYSSCRVAIHLRYGNVHSISYPDYLTSRHPLSPSNSGYSQ
ncbi:hypothetical protein CPAR01_07404 [Colletotrichum paranaense]|uniref:Uncharacterized protein n=1 Tax=Colletotrichum paranaense TaxID=1914294 RepID=A0ABQ9SQ03_9PEZI|nr:uncharacterized protein CPAR01_07404 [Colletotrichum paranaense]KAK1541415.1 hypothetical protein CPAR01_07404 [Colletotrichum paranaense]